MATPEAQLASFIAKYTPEIAALAEAVLNRMRMLYPTAVEIVYDNYNALAIGFGPSDRASEVIFSITIYPKWVSLFFMQAKGLSDHYGLLKGSGSVARHVVLKSLHMLDDGALQALMDDACAKAKLPLNAEGKHRLLIKSVPKSNVLAALHRLRKKGLVRCRRPSSFSARIIGIACIGRFEASGPIGFS